MHFHDGNVHLLPKSPPQCHLNAIFFDPNLLREQGQTKSPNHKGCPYRLLRQDFFVKHLQMFRSALFFKPKKKTYSQYWMLYQRKKIRCFPFLWWLTVTCVCHITILCLPLNKATLLRVSVDIFRSNAADQCPQSVKPVEVELLQWNCTRNLQCDKWDQNLTLLVAGDGRIR